MQVVDARSRRWKMRWPLWAWVSTRGRNQLASALGYGDDPSIKVRTSPPFPNSISASDPRLRRHIGALQCPIESTFLRATTRQPLRPAEEFGRRNETMTASGNPIRLLVVDDHPIVRGGIAALVATQSDLKLVAEASNAREAVQKFRTTRPDVTLLDIQMAGMDGIEALTAIRAEFPDARVIMLTTYGGDVPAMRALKGGAQAYLLKSSMQKELLDVIRDVHAGRKRIGQEVATELADHAADNALSAREVEVLRLIAGGNSNKLIADRLSISEDTVKGHVKAILSKLGASDRTHAVTISLKRGIITL